MLLGSGMGLEARDAADESIDGDFRLNTGVAQPLIPNPESLCLLVPSAMFVYILLRFPVDGALARRFAMIVDLLALGEGDLKLDHVLLQITERRDQGKTLFLDFARELIEFLTVEQQASVAQGFMIGVTPGSIRADVAVDQPRLPLLDIDVAVLQVDFPVPDRLHFGSRQLRARFILVHQVIQVMRLPIDGKVLRCGLGEL